MITLINETNQQDQFADYEWCIVPWTEALNAKIKRAQEFLKHNPDVQVITFKPINDGLIIDLDTLNKLSTELAELLYDRWNENGQEVIDLSQEQLDILMKCNSDNVSLVVTSFDFYFKASFEKGNTWTEVESETFNFPPAEGYKIAEPV